MINTKNSRSVGAGLRADIKWVYEAISTDSRYGHYARIPERICLCLDYFDIESNRIAVKERLHSYYLFIGVVDDVIDSTELETGAEILEWLADSIPSFTEETKQSPVRVVTELLKWHINSDIYPMALKKLEELYQAVVRERESTSMRVFIERRKAVGCLTAEMSYLLIRPLLKNDEEGLCGFMRQVGEVGCLIDSVIDLREDDRLGLMGFRPAVNDHIRLACQVLRDGGRVLLKHPRLFGLFLGAVGDDLLDRFSARGSILVSDRLDRSPLKRGVRLTLQDV